MTSSRTPYLDAMARLELERNQAKAIEEYRGLLLLSYQRKLAMTQRIERSIILPGSIPHLTSQYVFGFEQD